MEYGVNCGQALGFVRASAGSGVDQGFGLYSMKNAGSRVLGMVWGLRSRQNWRGPSPCHRLLPVQEPGWVSRLPQVWQAPTSREPPCMAPVKRGPGVVDNLSCILCSEVAKHPKPDSGGRSEISPALVSTGLCPWFDFNSFQIRAPCTDLEHLGDQALFDDRNGQSWFLDGQDHSGVGRVRDSAKAPVVTVFHFLGLPAIQFRDTGNEPLHFCVFTCSHGSSRWTAVAARCLDSAFCVVSILERVPVRISGIDAIPFN